MPRFLLKNVKVGLAWLWEGYLDKFLSGETVALLLSGGVTVERLFEQEGINTLDANGEVLLTILSSLAQQESES